MSAAKFLSNVMHKLNTIETEKYEFILMEKEKDGICARPSRLARIQKPVVFWDL